MPSRLRREPAIVQRRIAICRHTAEGESARLLTQAEFLDERGVGAVFVGREIAKEAISPSNHKHKTPSGVMIFLLRFQVFLKVSNVLGEQRDLDFRRAAVVVVTAV